MSAPSASKSPSSISNPTPANEPTEKMAGGKGSSKSRQGQDTSKERIHEAAVRLISRHGFDGMSLQKLADEVGLHKSTLFHHYPNKKAIARDIIGVRIAKVAKVMQSLAGSKPESLEELLTVSDALIDHFSDNPDTARLFLASMVAPDESELHEPVAEDDPTIHFYSVLISWLEQARSQGLIAHVSIRQAVYNMMGLMLLYPAVARVEAQLAGPDPFGAGARRMRKAMVRGALEGMLGLDNAQS